MKKLLAIAITSAITSAIPLTLNAQQTLTFTNPSPAVTINLLNGSSVNIQTNGNLSAQCQLDANNKCVGMPTGSSGTAPAVSIAASGFSNAADNENKYPAGTTFNITPTVSNAELCVRNILGATPGGTGWTGNAVSPFTATQVTLPSSSSSYEFSMRCYGVGGATTTSPNIILMTSQGVVGGNDQCDQQHVIVDPVAGFSVHSLASKFPDLKNLSGINIGDFPNTGGSIGVLVHNINARATLRFTVPTDASAFTGLSTTINWQEAQQGGEADANQIYVSVSQCPGDFRVPTQSGNAPANDPTFAYGCRNLRPFGNTLGINYEVNGTEVPSTNFVCNLKMGNVYYFNTVIRSPYVNSPPAITVSSPHGCRNEGATACGIQLKAE